MKYHVIREVLLATGTQTFEVEADSFEEAKEKVENGNGNIVEEEIEVQHLGDGSLVQNTETHESVEFNSRGNIIKKKP